MYYFMTSSMIIFLNNLAALLMHCFMNNYTHVWNKIILLLKILCLDKFFILLSLPGPPPHLICLQNQLLFIQQQCLRWRHCKSSPWQCFCLYLYIRSNKETPLYTRSASGLNWVFITLFHEVHIDITLGPTSMFLQTRFSAVRQIWSVAVVIYSLSLNVI